VKIPIACTLSVDETPDRVEEWRDALESAQTREATPDGYRLRFSKDPAFAARLADLAAREVECCAFFTFRVTVTHTDLVLDVLAPTEAHDMIGALFGPVEHA
jgi:MerR family transcriptional regulator, copper efflux regulator